MLSLSEIESEIKPVLERVEKIRRGKIRGSIWGKLIPLFMTALSLYFGYDLYATGKNGAWFFLLFPVVLWWFVKALQDTPSTKENRYLSIFRKKVLGALIQHFYPNASYRHYTSIAKKTLERSQLFSFVSEQYQLEDYFVGETADQVSFKFAELDNGLGTPSRGIFFEVNLPQQAFISEPVLLLPIAQDHKIPSSTHTLSLASFLEQQNIKHWQKDKDFHAPYLICCENPSVLPKVLTPALLGAVYNLYQQWNKYLHVSIVGQTIYLFLEYEGDWLETSLKQSLLQSDILKDLYRQLALCFHLLEDLGKEDWQPSKIAINQVINWEKELYKHLLIR
ncbi:MAG: DUF3137 domain-containing protein [Aureispira sp.]